ncbi:SGNH/GDSL hydrolase family protein [Rhodococcus sp. Z13]|uniref:SGNH/GDSL hydrolase family protein n=1 Tax=Rhodococcus sacchari TaxID=2962047 RepID=A0ACD4DK12_9NOCA|nr:SGNH/GDSL hydrolase family protein [Rhodococcus sp. Z13]UYP20399.1 SGNH/GDSL hydrolase family protein [Rhodococcus sp. Z13]
MRIPALLRRTGVVACATAVLTGTGTVACSAAVPDTVYDSYVALGDSFTAGPGIPAQRPGDPCGRSESNYPSLVAAELGITDFVDASCSAADSADLSQPQRPGVPPQYDALRPDTDLVTVGIGGNDIGLVQLALGCVDLGAQPHGASCATTNTAGDTDRVGETIDAFAPTYTAIVDEIRRRSPEARIVFVGYPTGIRDGGCYPVQRIRPDDATYLQAEIDRLNTVMREQVEAAGAEFVDLRESSRGHDACAEPAERWMQGLELTLESIPLHPNAAGHRHAADRVLTELAVR